MKIVFLGSGAFGLPTLEALSRAHEVVGVVTQPDRPAGRGKKLTPNPIAQFAAEGLSSAALLKPENINDLIETSRVRDLSADAWVVIAYGQKLGKALLDGVFAVNLHASLLPRWRGAAPINHAILAGDETTGNSVITLADRMDAGLVLGQTRRRIDPLQTAGELHDLLSQDGPALVLDVLDRFSRGALEPREQDESLVTLAGKLDRQRDGWVDFAQPADDCRRRVHGLTPWPGVSVSFREAPLKPLRVQPLDPAPERPSGASPGEIVDAGAGLVACGGASVLRLLEVQPAGGRPMAWADFARGRCVREGETLIGKSSAVGEKSC